MPSAVTLVIYVSSLAAADPSSPALLRATRELLGERAQITLLSVPAPASDEALGASDPAADAVAEIDWLTSDHRRAAVRCYVTRLHRTLRREISFDEDAELDERERMLGFVVASLLPAATESSVSETSVRPTPPAAQPAKPAAAQDSPPTVAPPPERFLGLAEIVGLGATGIGGTGSSFGGALGGRLSLTRVLSLRLAGGLRRGEIPVASATSDVEFLSLGLAVEYTAAAESHFSLGGRSSALLLRHEVDHLSSDDVVPDRQSRLLAGADGFLEGAWHFSSAAGLVAGLGAELAFGHTDIFVKGSKVAEIPPLRGLLELGIQAKF